MNKITVITTTRNDMEGLLVTRQSLMQQSTRPFEYIVLDGGSDAYTEEMFLSSALPFEKSILGGRDHGVYDGMNKAAAIASGEWILFLNSGDRFSNGTTLASLESLELDSASVVYGNNRVLTESGLVWERKSRN